MVDLSRSTNSHNWPMWWRCIILANICIYTTMGNYFTASISPLLMVFVHEFHVDIAEAAAAITLTVLAIGLSNIFAVPISQYIGKRYTVIFSMAIFLACNIWCIYVQSMNELKAARIVGGLGAGIVEALGPLIVAECFPERQLASAMVIYAMSLGAGASIGPFIAGVVDNAGLGWRYNFIISSCIVGANLLGCIVMLPETIDRDLQKEETASTSSNDDIEKNNSIVDAEEVEHSNAAQPQESLMQVWIRRSFFITLPDIKPQHNFFVLVIQPWAMLMSPAVLVGCIIFGVMIAFTLIASVVFSAVLQSPPALWSVLQIGLLNLSTLVGLLIGIPLGGITADILSRRSARKNDGIHIRESRLPAVIPGAILAPVGILVIGICLQQNLSWVGMAIGWAMLSVPLTASANVLLTYAVDCYLWRAAHIGVMINVMKNLVAFGVSYGVTPWLMAVGPEKQFGTMAGILVFFFLFVIPLYTAGPRLRQWSLRWIM